MDTKKSIEPRGLFVTIEGIDGSGKSTQVQLLHQHLTDTGFAVLVARDPGGTPIGEKIRDILLDAAHHAMCKETEFFLYEASRAQLCREVILPWLELKNIVIGDRFFDSTTAYQGFGRQLDIAYVKQSNTIATDGRKPDLTFLLDLAPADGFSRIGREKDRMETQDTDFYKKLRSGFLTLQKEEPQRIILIDACQSTDVVHQRIIECIQEQFPQIKN